MGEDARGSKNQKNNVSSLSEKQERMIMAVLESRSIEEACKKAGVSRTHYYRRLREDAAFGAALKARREAANNEALGRLRNGVGFAVDVLVGLLASENEWVRRVAANDVISRFLKARELEELEGRVQRIETSLRNKRD